MNDPARRDGTPEQKPKDTDIYLSKAKPAKRQHVTESELAKASDSSPKEKIRLQKVLAAAGVASRRMSEKLIAAGRVEVNGEVVQQMGLRINPNVDIVRVDGTRVQVNEEMVYFILNKPRGCLLYTSDAADDVYQV